MATGGRIAAVCGGRCGRPQQADRTGPLLRRQACPDMKPRMKCARCRDTYWVCERHDDRPWDGEHACGCGGAGMPCPSCNVSNPDNPPRLPVGFHRDESLDDE